MTRKDRITNIAQFIASLGGVVVILVQFNLIDKVAEGYALAAIAFAAAVTAHFTGKSDNGDPKKSPGNGGDR
jgi:VIT1/CCC1 family predicted Fe2+/Mn2+ transporter